MENQKLEILVIEDNSKHLEDAKTFIQSQINRGASISASYATTYTEAKAILDSKRLGGIISDVFFPYDSNGKSSFAKEKCLRILREEGATENLRYEHQKGLDSWAEREEMHPTGIMVTDFAIKNKIPIVLCTDTNHHGSSTQTISNYSSKMKSKGIDVPLIDTNPKDMFYGRSSEKDWCRAYKSVMAQISRNSVGITLEQDDEIFRKDKSKWTSGEKDLVEKLLLEYRNYVKE